MRVFFLSRKPFTDIKLFRVKDTGYLFRGYYVSNIYHMVYRIGAQSIEYNIDQVEEIKYGN